MKRILALFVMIILVAGSAVFGMWRSLNAMRGEVEKAFVTPENDGGYISPSIQDDLFHISGESHNLLVVAKNYYDDRDQNTASLILAHERLAEAVTVGEKFTALTALSEAVASLYRQIADDPQVTEQHRKLAKTYYGDITSTMAIISDNHYNEKAAEFNEKLGGFPAVFVAPLFGIEKADLFK